MSEVLIDERFDASPHRCREFHVPLPDGIEATALQLAVYDAAGNELVSYRPKKHRREDAAAGSSDCASQRTSIPPSRSSWPDCISSSIDTRLASRRIISAKRCCVIRATFAAIWRLGRILYRRGEYRAAEAHFRRGRRACDATQSESRPMPNAITISGWRWRRRTSSMQRRKPFTNRLGIPAARTRPIFNWQELLCAGAIGRRPRNCCDDASHRNAQHHQAIHLLVIALIEQGKRDAAVELADRELKRDPVQCRRAFRTSQFARWRLEQV